MSAPSPRPWTPFSRDPHVRRQRGEGRRLGKRRLSYEINKQPEGIYALLDVNAEPAAVKELDRQLSLQDTVLRTKVLRRDPAKAVKAKA